MQDIPFECEEIYKANQLCIALSNMMLLINSALDTDEIMKQIVVETAKTIGCESARIALRENDQWRVQYRYNVPDVLRRDVFSDEELPHASLAMITKKPVAIDDAFTDSRTNTKIMKQLGIRSVLVLPLLERQEVIGVVLLNYHLRNVSFDQAEIVYAERVSAAVAVAIQKARLYQDQERIKQDLEEASQLYGALTCVEASMYTSLDADQIMRNVLRDASVAIGAETAMIFSREGNDWLVRYVYKLSESLVGRRFTSDEVKHTAITAETREGKLWYLYELRN